MSEAKKNGLVWLAVGCGGLLLIVGIGMGVFAYLGMKFVKDAKAGLEKPEAKALEVLGMDAMPEGYYAQMALSVPFVMEMAILGDQPKTETGNKINFARTKHGLMFVKLIGNQRKRERFEEQLRDPNAERVDFSNNNAHFEFGELLRNGALDFANGKMVYRIQRGVALSSDGEANLKTDGYSMIFSYGCAQDDKLRMGYWFIRAQDLEAVSQAEAAPVEGEEQGAASMASAPLSEEELDAILASTPFTPEKIKAFFEPMNLCK